MSNIAIEQGPVEIVDLPINSMVIFHSHVSLPEGNWMKWKVFPKSGRQNQVATSWSGDLPTEVELSARNCGDVWPIMDPT